MNPYASFLGTQEPRQVIASTPVRLKELLDSMGVEKAGKSPAPGKWSAREILCHLADCEIVFAFRLRQTLAEPHHIIQPFDQDAWAKRYQAYTFEPALALFQSARNWNLLYFTSVSQDDRHRRTTHPERGTMNFWTIVETMAGHDINHLQQIERLASTPQT